MTRGKPRWAGDAPVVAKKVHIKEAPRPTQHETVAWKFGRRDRTHPSWGWDRLPADRFWAVVDGPMASFETMSWGEIYAAAGGRARGTNHHPIALSECCPAAQRRLTELELDDYEELVSFRLTGRQRLIGLRDGRAFIVLWFDENHEVCPVRRH